ncbi:MAG TPA: ABC transporter ATP-binding protein [Treponema sp.]|nr:ABC transporter ATP-binding protein [Treponema sp.]
MNKQVILDFNQVSFSYGEVPVLNKVSFHLHRGEFTVLVGTNGSGKTTVLKLILGLLKPNEGEISLFGALPASGRAKTGYVPQFADYDPTFPITVREVIRMGRLTPTKRRFTAIDTNAIDRAMEQSDITALATRPYASLSGGQRRRVLVARALAAEPELLILDEPTANMDSESEGRLFETLGHLKDHTTIMIVTHDTGFVTSLTDVVLCVGDRNTTTGAQAIVRHDTEPAENAPPERFGGKAVRVLHNSSIRDSCCESYTGGRK